MKTKMNIVAILFMLATVMVPLWVNAQKVKIKTTPGNAILLKTCFGNSIIIVDSAGKSYGVIFHIKFTSDVIIKKCCVGYEAEHIQNITNIDERFYFLGDPNKQEVQVYYGGSKRSCKDVVDILLYTDTDKKLNLKAKTNFHGTKLTVWVVKGKNSL